MGKKFNPNYNYKSTSDYDYDKANRIIDNPTDSSEFINNRDWVEGDPYDNTLPMLSDSNNNSDMFVEAPNNSNLPMPNEDNGFWGKLQNWDGRLNNSVNDFMNSNSIGRFISRFGEAGARAITGDAVSNTDTGSKIANAAADFIGTGAGFMTRLPGLDFSIGSAMNKAIGKPVENVLNDVVEKYGANSRLTDYGIQALKTGAEFGGYEGLNNAIQGKDTGDGIAEGMAQGMLWGAGGKALGEILHAIPGIGKVKVLNDDGNRVTFQDENGNVQDMNKVIFDNTAERIPQSTIDNINKSNDLSSYSANDLLAARKYNNEIKNSIDNLGFNSDAVNNDAITNEIRNRLGAVGGPKYTIKNTAKDQALQDYQDAIDTIHNYFGTNKLTPEEVSRIKPELGIDLEQLLNNIDNAKTDVRVIGDRQRLRRIAGVDNTLFEPVTLNTEEQIPYVKIKKYPKTTEKIPSVMTYKEKIPIIENTSEQIPLVRVKKERNVNYIRQETNLPQFEDTSKLIDASEKVPLVRIKKEKVNNSEVAIDNVKSINSMTKDELFNAIGNTKLYQKYKPTETSVDWGIGKARGQGKRVGNMIIGAMSDAPQGKKTYVDLVGNVPEYKTIPEDFKGMENVDKINYLKAREYGLNHDQAMVYQIVKNDNNGLTDNQIMDRINHFQEIASPKTLSKNNEGALLSGDSNIVDRQSLFTKKGKAITKNIDKIEHDLIGLENGETTADEVINNLDFKGRKVHGYNLTQRHQIAEELIKGLDNGKSITHIDVINDGKIDAVNNKSTVSEILDRLDIKNVRDFNASPKKLPTFNNTLDFKGYREQPLTQKIIDRNPTNNPKYEIVEKVTHNTLPDFSGYIEKPIERTVMKSQSTPIWSGTENKILDQRLPDKESGYRTVTHEEAFGIPQNTKYPNVKLPKLKKPMSAIKEEGNINIPTDNKTTEMPPMNIPMPNKVANAKMDTADNSIEIPIVDIIRPDFNPESKPAQNIVSSKQKSNFKDLLQNFYTHVVDINNPIKKVDNESYVKATNSKNVGGTVDYIMTKGLVNTNGNKIGDSLAKVIDSIPKNQYNDFWEYALQRHNIARSGEGKPVFTHEDGNPYMPKESAERVKLLEQQHPDWKDKANNITKWIDNFMQEWGVNTGIVNGDLYKSLRKTYPDYIPTNREFNDLEDFIPGGSGNGKGFVNQGTPLKKATGSDRNIIDPTENIMNLVNRTVRAARYNEVGKSILDAVTKDPAGLKNLAEIIPDEIIPKTKTDNIVKVLIDGNPVYMKINDKGLLGAIEGINKSNVGDIEAKVKKATNMFKSLITTRNPVFAIRNIARDIPTYLVNTKENNPVKALGNLGSAFKDLITNADVYQQYKGLGGGGSNFFNSEHPYKSVKELNNKKWLPMIGDKIEAFNNLFESAPRLAEFKNTLKKTGDVNQALYDAADVTTNFSRGGDYTKHIDSGVPYLNAGVQGLDKLARQFKDRPIATVLKGATTITAPTLLINYMNKDNKNYQDLDNRTKDNYYLFPYGDKFIKIPKSRELGVLFGSLAERTLRKIQGDPQAFKNFANTALTNFAPSNPIENNIAAPFIYNIPSNKDFAGRSIVPQNMQDRSPALQYDEKTSEIAKKIGELTNLSPKQIDYVIKSYTGVVGQLALPAATKSNYSSNTIDNLLMPITSQFTADPLYNNQSLQDFYDNMQKTKTVAVDKNFIGNIDSKTTTHEERLSSEFTKANKEISELSKQSFDAMQKGDMDTVKKLRQQIVNIAAETNKYIPLPGQDASQLPMPVSELKANIDDQIKYNRSKQATSIRTKADQISKSNLSIEEKNQLLNDLMNRTNSMQKGKAPKKKAEKTNPYNK